MTACTAERASSGRTAARTLDLSIIIVTWNNEREIGDCLQSIRDCSDVLECEIFVIDNASRDATCALIREQFPEASLIANQENRGFPAANNQGFERATGRHTLILNPDTILQPGTLRACVDYLDSHPATGAVGSRLIYASGETQYDGARKFPDLSSLLAESLYLHMLLPRIPFLSGTHLRHWDHLDSREVPCLSGSFMLVRSEIVRQLGGMNTDVFMFYEDMDFCFRIRRAGWKIYYLASVSTVHLHGASKSGSVSSLAGPTLWTFFRQHRGPAAAGCCRAILLFRAVVRLAAGSLLAPFLRSSVRGRQTSLTDLGSHWKLLRWAVGCASRDPSQIPAEVAPD